MGGYQPPEFRSEALGAYPYRGPLDWLGGLAESTLFGTGELLGFEAPRRVQKFRQTHPLGGLLSQGLGFMVPYGGMFKLSRLPRAAKLLERVVGGVKNPFLRGALRETARMSPLDVGRFGTGTLLAGRDPVDMAYEVAVSLGLEFGVGGALGGISASGAGRGIMEKLITQGVDPGSSPTLMLRNLRQSIRAGKELPEKLTEMENVARKLERHVREELVGPSKLAVETRVEGMEEPIAKFVHGEMSRAMEAYVGPLEVITGKNPSVDAVRSLLIPESQLKRLIKKPWVEEKKAADTATRRVLESRFGDKVGYERAYGPLSPVPPVQVGRKLASHRMAWGTKENAFSNEAQVMKRLELVQAPEDFFSFTQYPRIVTETALEGQYAMTNVLRKNFTSGSEGWWWVREADDGLYILAKEIPIPRQGAGVYDEAIGAQRKALGLRPESPDLLQREWVVLKTDAPEQFMKDAATWTDNAVRKSAWALAPGIRLAGYELPTYDALRKLLTDEAIVNYIAEVAADPRKRGRRDWIAKITGLDKAADNEMISRTLDVIDTIVTPRAFQGRGSDLTKRLLAGVMAAEDLMNATARELIFGRYEFIAKKNLAWQGLLGSLKAASGKKESVENLIKKLNSKDMEDLWHGWDKEIGPEGFAKQLEEGLISDETHELAMRLDEIFGSEGSLIRERRATQAIAGLDETQVMPGHMGIARWWEGDHRVYFTDTTGAVVDARGHRSIGELKKIRQIVLEEAEAEGKKWTASDIVLADQATDREMELYRALANRAGTADEVTFRNIKRRTDARLHRSRTDKPRTGVPGYIDRFTHENLTSAVYAHAKSLTRQIAETALEVNVQPHLQKMYLFGDTHGVNIIRRNMDAAFGRPGPISTWINRGADKILAPILGKDSASRIALNANKFMMHLTLGAGNIAYSAMAALTFMQTVLPEISFMTSAAPWRRARHMGWLPVVQGGKVVGDMGFLDVMKITARAFREMGRPGRRLLKSLNRAANDGTLEAMEVYIAKISAGTLSLKEVWQHPKKYASYIKRLSEFGMAAPERISRMHSFSIGHIIARDLLGMVDEEELYRFAKQFTDNTMFRYARSDKAALLTGPAGSVFGLFKNWAMHYMYNFGRYADEAFNYGNLKPLLWQAAGTGLMAGVSGWPLYSMADGFSRFVSKTPLMEHIYSTFNLDEENTLASDAIFMGLPAMLGASLSTQAQAPFANPMRDASMIFSMVQLDRGVALGNALHEAGEYIGATGRLNPLQSPRVREMLARATAPKTFYRALAAFTTDGLKSLRTGYPMIKDVSLASKLFYSLGFNPPEIERSLRVAHDLWEDLDERKRTVAAYGKAWSDASQAGDRETLRDLRNRIHLYGLNYDTIIASARSREAKAGVGMIDRTYGYDEIQRRLRSLGGR